MAARRLRSRPDPNAPTHHDRDVVASRRSASRVAWGFPSGAQGSGPPTHPHASCDKAYALTVRIRSKLTLRRSSRAAPRHDAAEDLVSSTRSPLSRMTMSDLFTSLDRTGIRRRLEPAPVLQPRTPHSSTCARLCTLFSCTRVFLVLGARPSICFRCTSRVISVTEP